MQCLTDKKPAELDVIAIPFVFVDALALSGDAHAQHLLCPRRATANAAGFDLVAANHEPIDLKPLARAKVPTGIALGLPDGFEAQVRPRSGLAAKHGVTVLNSPGTIDADYRGEVQVILINLSEEVFRIERGMRVAQLVIGKTAATQLEATLALDRTERGAQGFGSTGM